MIKNSVGRGGLNKKADVKVVQQLLNNYINTQYVIFFANLIEDGICGNKTIDAIKLILNWLFLLTILPGNGCWSHLL